MNPHRFLTAAGSLLGILGVFGADGLLGRLSSASLFNPPAWINWLHIAAGSLLLAVARYGQWSLQTRATAFAAIVPTTVGIGGLLFGGRAAQHFNRPQLADPSDHLMHLLVGLAALSSLMGRRRTLRELKSA